MPDEFSPDLGGLESDYRIDTELRHARRSRTFLARHLGLNRDVTIQVYGAPKNEHDNSLTLFASDARTLSVIKHPNVVPVIEARWLGGNFAVVRPRVRGALLDEVVASEGPLAASRTANVLEQVSSAVAWARDNGIVHRRLPGDAVRFQQGSGRVLVEMEFAPLGTGGGVPDECDDARTIGQLAFEMLSGRRPDDAGGPLAEQRQDLPQRVIRELSTVMNCDRRTGARDPHTLIAYLKDVPDSSFVPRPPRRDAAPRVVADAPPPPSKPRDTPPDKGRMGFGARLVILAAISTAVGAAGTLVYRREPPPITPEPVKARVPTTTSAGGEVVRTKPTTPAPAAHPAAPIDSPPTKPRVEPPTTRRHEPLRGAPPATLPKQPAAGTADSSKPGENASVLAACESTDAEDQHTCLVGSIEQGDKPMNAVYDRLIAALRRQAKAQLADPDPATVVQLKTAQRSWLGARDIECRDVGEEPLYARDRAQCYTDAADRRARDLQQMLDGLG